MSSPKAVDKVMNLLSENEKFAENSNFSKNNSPTVAEGEKEEASLDSGSSNNNAELAKASPSIESENVNNMNSLPHPWSALWDANYSCYYYWNSETNETTYTPPISSVTYIAGSSSQNNSNPSGSVEALNSTLPGPKGSQGAAVSDYSKFYYPGQVAGTDSPYSAYYSYYQSFPGVNSSHSTNDPEYAEFMSKEHGFDPALSDVKVAGRFNAKTGLFQAEDAITPEKFSQESKALRQCNAFFDYESYIEQRGMQRSLQYNNLVASKQPKLPKKTLEKLKRMKKEKKLESKKKWLRDI